MYRVQWGLSPRMRGNHDGDGFADKVFRSIPAYAGEPGHIRRQDSLLAVYPRVCGGTTLGRTRPRRSSGLSPRMRGNLYVVGPDGKHIRSIPAYAGEPAVASAARATL